VKLQKVVYELFESDYASIAGNENAKVHEIDGEVRLVFDGGKTVFVSWADKPVQYCVGFQQRSWNDSEPEMRIAASEWKMWAPCVGQAVELIFLDKERQVLEVRSPEGSVFFCSMEEDDYYQDVLHITSEKPSVTR